MVADRRSAQQGGRLGEGELRGENWHLVGGRGDSGPGQYSELAGDGRSGVPGIPGAAAGHAPLRQDGVRGGQLGPGGRTRGRSREAGVSLGS